MFARYLPVSVCALAVDYGLYWAFLAEQVGFSPPLAATLAYLTGAAVHYVLSRRFVFAPGWLHAKLGPEFMLFLATGLVGAAITALVVALVSLMPGAGIHWPRVAAVVVSFFAVYLARKYLVFRRAASS